ncbi:unnamed protein product [Urochloa humidicola]
MPSLLDLTRVLMGLKDHTNTSQLISLDDGGPFSLIWFNCTVSWIGVNCQTHRPIVSSLVYGFTTTSSMTHFLIGDNNSVNT